MRTSTSRLRRLPWLAAIALAAACGGGGGGSGGLTFDLLLADSTVDGLLSLTVTVDELRLVQTTGDVSANLLPEPVRIEILGLGLQPTWLTRADLKGGTYDTVRVGFEPGSVEARAETGAEVQVDELGDELVAAIDPPLVAGSYNRIVVDVDLENSLAGDVASPPIAFQPEGRATGGAGSAPAAVDEFLGVVFSFNEAIGTIVVSGFADEALQRPLGLVPVRFESSALYLDPFGLPFASKADFFAVLEQSLSVLEIHGQLGADGKVTAQRVALEGQDGGAAGGIVRVEGVITGIDLLFPGIGTLELLIREVDRGADVATPVLATLGNPASILVGFDEFVTLTLDESGAATDTEAFRVGQDVDVRFLSFTGEPFLAAEVEIEDEAEVEGIITDVAGLPASFIFEANADEPAVTFGLIAPGADVFASTAAPIRLDTEGEPLLASAQLLTGLEVEVEGPIRGTPVAPTIATSEVKVRAGRLDGQVTGTTPAKSSFDTSVISLIDPFGDVTGAPPFTVEVPPNAVVRGAASNLEGLFLLFDGLLEGQFLNVEVRGIGSGEPGVVLAYEIDARVE